MTRIAALRKKFAALRSAGAVKRSRSPARRTSKATTKSGTKRRPTAKRTGSTKRTGATKRPAKRPAKKALAGLTGRRPARRPSQAAEPDRKGPLTGVARGALMLVAFIGMVLFAIVLAKLTLVPSPASAALVHANFHPGSSIRAYVDQPAFRDTIKQIGGNVVLGVPFGLLMPVLFPRTRGLVRVVLVTALVMLCVEVAQGTLVKGRAFDIDDVILNTFGALLGYVFVGRRLGRSVHPRRHHWWQRRTASSSGTG